MRVCARACVCVCVCVCECVFALLSSVAVLEVEFAFRGRILCFCRMVDLVVLNLESDRSKFCKMWFGRNHGDKNQALHLAWTGNHRQDRHLRAMILIFMYNQR